MNKILIFLSAILLTITSWAQNTLPDTLPMYNPNDFPFFYGVASGESHSNGFIIWTKITPEAAVDSLTVRWCVSTSTRPKDIVAMGTATALKHKDYTVKIHVSGLKPFTHYYYWFKVCPQPGIPGTHGKCYQSPMGKAMTTPAPDQLVNKISLAVFTGSNYNAGFFNAYCAVAQDTSINFAIHTGDYIYEYGNNTYGKNPQRRLYPAHELITRKDYNLRYAQYRLDTCLKKAHQAFSWYLIPDDHEVANDSWKNGAQNHQPNEGNYHVRKANALAVYYNWLPIAENTDTDFFRTIDMGKLATVIFIDTRHHGRDYQRLNPWDTNKTMIGHDQLQWLFQQLLLAKKQNKKWIIVTQQLLFAPLVFFGDTLNHDGWDMYPLERRKILKFLHDNNINNVVFLGGDFHTSWANELYLNPENFHCRRCDTLAAMEFVTPSITSPNANWLATAIMKTYTKIIPRKRYIRYVDLHHKGFLKINIYPDKIVAQWYFVKTIKKPDTKILLRKTFIYKGLQH